MNNMQSSKALKILYPGIIGEVENYHLFTIFCWSKREKNGRTSLTRRPLVQSQVSALEVVHITEAPNKMTLKVANMTHFLCVTVLRYFMAQTSAPKILV